MITLGPMRRWRAGWVAGLGAASYIACAVAAYLFLDLGAWHDWAAALPAGWLLIALAVLPLLGSPVSVLYLMVGARFGLLGGIFCAVLAIAFHLLGAHWIGTSYLRARLTALLRRTRFRLPTVPKQGRTAIALLTALVPGPYSVKNYLLAISGLPLKAFFTGCWPVYVVQASEGILFGHLSGQLNAWRVAFFIVYALGIALLSRHLVRAWQARVEAEAGLTP